MAGTPAKVTIPRLEGARVALVAAPYHRRIHELLRSGALRVLEAAGATAVELQVPGALEIPPAVAAAARFGRFDAYVALGCVVRGETFHFELVALESARGLMRLAVERELAIGNGILTVDDLAQAERRADPEGEDKGGWAAYAALSLLALKHRLEADR